MFIIIYHLTEENEVESVGNMRQQQTNLSMRLNEENEMKLFCCFAEKQEAFVLCKNAEMQ